MPGKSLPEPGIDEGDLCPCGPAAAASRRRGRGTAAAGKAPSGNAAPATARIDQCDAAPARSLGDERDGNGSFGVRDGRGTKRGPASMPGSEPVEPADAAAVQPVISAAASRPSTTNSASSRAPAVAASEPGLACGGFPLFEDDMDAVAVDAEASDNGAGAVARRSRSRSQYWARGGLPSAAAGPAGPGTGHALTSAARPAAAPARPTSAAASWRSARRPLGSMPASRYADRSMLIVSAARRGDDP